MTPTDPRMVLTPSEWQLMEERGRRKAAAVLADKPHKLRELEAQFGKPYIRARYPEVYERHRWRELVGRLARLGRG